MAYINWEALKAEYVASSDSLQHLADVHGIAPSMIYSRSAAEHWTAARKAYRQRVAKQALEKAEPQQVDRLLRLMNTTEKAIDVAEKAFEDPEQFNRYIVKTTERYAEPEKEDGSGQLVLKEWSEEQVFKKVDAKALKTMTGVLKDLTGMMRDFYDIPTAAQAEARQAAQERLALEKRRAAAAETGAEVIEVVFSAGEEAWNA